MYELMRDNHATITAGSKLARDCPIIIVECLVVREAIMIAN